MTGRRQFRWPDFRPLLRRLIVAQDLYFARKDRLLLPKCRKCARHVKSPCHDAEGYHQDGPWDTWCHDVFGRNFY